MNTRMMMMMKKLLVRHFLQVLNLMSIHLMDKLLSEKWVFKLWIFTLTALEFFNQLVIYSKQTCNVS